MPESLVPNLRAARERLCHAEVCAAGDPALIDAIGVAIDALDALVLDRPWMRANYGRSYFEQAQEKRNRAWGLPE